MLRSLRVEGAGAAATTASMIQLLGWVWMLRTWRCFQHCYGKRTQAVAHGLLTIQYALEALWSVHDDQEKQTTLNEVKVQGCHAHHGRQGIWQ